MEKVKADLEKLNNQKKLLEKERNAEERKTRTHRLCQRGGTVEKLFPDLIKFTDEQFTLFVDKTLLTDHTRRIIADIVSGQLNPPPAATQGDTRKPTGASTHGNGKPAAPAPADAEQGGGVLSSSVEDDKTEAGA